MRVTIVPIDNMIMIDGKPLIFPFEAQNNVHAIQWKTDKGHIEYTDGKMNKELSGNADYLIHVLPFVDLWEKEKVRLEKEPPYKPTFAEAYTAKYEEIINGANAVKSALSRKYSDLEEQTWPEQEAGARAIVGLVNEGQSSRAWFILQDEEQTNKAKTFVADLAKLAGVSPQQYAERILKNASNYTEKSKQILYQEIALKAQLNAADTIEKIEAINVFYPE